MRIVHLLIAGGRTDHRQSTPDETRAPSLVSPSPRLQFLDYILNISLQNSWNDKKRFDLKKGTLISNENEMIFCVVAIWSCAREIAKCDSKRQRRWSINYEHTKDKT